MGVFTRGWKYVKANEIIEGYRVCFEDEENAILTKKIFQENEEQK